MRKIIDVSYADATRILTENKVQLRAMAEALLKYETIDHIQIDAIMEGREPPPPEEWTSGGPTAPVVDGESKSDDKSDLGNPAEQH